MVIETLCRHSAAIAEIAMNDYRHLYRFASIGKGADEPFDFWTFLDLFSNEGNGVLAITEKLSVNKNLNEAFMLNDLGMFRIKTREAKWTDVDMTVTWQASKNHLVGVRYVANSATSTEGASYSVTVSLYRENPSGITRSSSVEYVMTGHPVIPLCERIKHLAIYLRNNAYDCGQVENSIPSDTPFLKEAQMQALRVNAKFTVPLSSTPIHHPLDASLRMREVIVNRPAFSAYCVNGTGTIVAKGVYRAGAIKYYRTENGLEIECFSMSGLLTTNNPHDYESVRNHINRIVVEQEKYGVVLMPEEDMTMMRLQYGC